MPTELSDVDHEEDNDMTNCHILKTQKGSDKLYAYGYTFYLKSKSEQRNYKRWECTYRSHLKGEPVRSCGVKAVTDFQIKIFIKKPGCHSHDFDCMAVERNIFNEQLELGGTINRANSGIIINDALSTLDPDVHGYLPSKSACYAKIRRAREKAGHTVKEITSMEDIKEEYRNTIGTRPKQFLQTIVGNTEAHALIFATADSLMSLFESRMWYADGIYKTTDNPYLQVYVIHGTLKGDHEHRARPLMYCIMSRKNFELYSKIFEFIKGYGLKNNLELKTQYIMIDFEMAVKSAIVSVFENQIRVFGCSFHLKMNLREKALESDKGIFTGKNEQLNFNRIFSLIYLPHERLRIILPLLKNYLQVEKSPLLELLMWFEDTYIRTGSRYECWWNVYTLIEEKLPTTNNIAESFFSKFRKLLDNSNTTLYCIVGVIQKIQNTVDGDMLKINEGLVDPTNTYFRKVNKIKDILEGYRYSDLMLLDKLGQTTVPMKRTGLITNKITRTQFTTVPFALPGPSGLPTIHEQPGNLMQARDQSFDLISERSFVSAINGNSTMREENLTNSVPIKRKRGRPCRQETNGEVRDVCKRKRGRPPGQNKNVPTRTIEKRKRGRPPKTSIRISLNDENVMAMVRRSSRLNKSD